MFRPMRRIKQALPSEKCAEVLAAAPRGVLSLLGDDGYPYGVPMDHWYCPESGRLYFHCARAGHKLDAMAACNKVSYCVLDEGYRKDGQWPLYFKSVIVFGRLRPVADPEMTERVCRALCGKFTDDPEYAERELRTSGAAVLCLELTPEHITGKLVKES